MPLHRWPGGSLPPAGGGVGRVLVLGGDGDRGEEEPVSRRPANRDRGHVLQESARSRFDRHVVDHPGALQNVRHRAAIVTDSEEPGGGPRELDIRAFQTGRRIRASERADDRLLNCPIGTFLCVSRRLDLDRGRRGFRVPWQADDDRQPARTLAFQHLHVVRNFLVCREDRHGACGQRLAPAGVVHVVDLPVDQVDDDLLGLVGMTPELRARGGHCLGEPFERQPRSLLSTREQQARGLVRCIDFPMGDRQASGFLRARHGCVSGTREATPTNIVRGIRKTSYRLLKALGDDPKPLLGSAIRNSNAFRKSIPRARHSSASRDTNGAIVSRSPIRARSTARSDPSRRLAIASATPHRASSGRVNIFLTPASANTSATWFGDQPPVGGYAGAKPTNVVRPASARARRQRSRASIGGAQGSSKALARSSSVGTDMPTSISGNCVKRSRSRIMSGARERMDTGQRAFKSTSSAWRGIRYFPSTNWYGSVAVEIATRPLGRRLTYFARTVAAFRFTTTEAPHALRSIWRSRGTKQKVHP